VNESTRHKTLAAAAASAWEAFVIVVGMLKGGTGKTTSAWFIALYYAVVLGLPTLLLDSDATSQSAYDWFKVAQAAGFEIPANLVVERYPFDDIAEYIREKRAEFGAIVVDAGGGSAKLFHEAVTEANLLLVPVAPTKIERRKLVTTFDEAERAAARNQRNVTAHVVMVKADDRTSLPSRAKDKLLEPSEGEGIGPDRDEPFPLAETVIHSWVHYMFAPHPSTQIILNTRHTSRSQLNYAVPEALQLQHRIRRYNADTGIQHGDIVALAVDTFLRAKGYPPELTSPNAETT
jgi:chromosome partitioning protein